MLGRHVCLAALAAMLLMGMVASVASVFPVRFNEVKINPPGANDAPDEFIELEGTPGISLSNLTVLTIDGAGEGNPGMVTWKAELTAYKMGANGLLLIAAPTHRYQVPTATTMVLSQEMDAAGGCLSNRSTSLFLMHSVQGVNVQDDLDRGNNGVLEGLPQDAVILDALAWEGGGKDEVLYGEVKLTLSGATPDAATRLPWNDTANSAAAWVWGDLLGTNGDTLEYDDSRTSAGFPIGTKLSPGAANNIAPTASGLQPISGVIGDPFNPVLRFTVEDDGAPLDEIVATAYSSNADVVPDANLSITTSPGGVRALAIQPVGVGYSTLTICLSDGSLVGRVNVPYAASAPGRLDAVWHTGSCDASSAIALDETHMIVGDDENQVLRLYNRGRPGLALKQFDFTSYLGLPDVQSSWPREVDIEGSTSVGKRSFWIGSLGHAADGEPRTNRTRLFATDLAGAGAGSQLSYAGRYDYLKADLIAWDMRNQHGKGTNYYGLEASDADGVPPKAPDGSGFAIEGLSMMSNNTNGAYIAFRAPIVPPTNRTYALIVPVLNFATLAASGAPAGSAVIGEPIELDLFNRGIRSIEGTTNGYFVIAGPPSAGTGPYPRDFRLYTWSGSVLDAPQERGADLTGLNPEGIVEVPSGPWDENTTLQLLSDEGATVFYGDGIQAKFLREPNFKKFRSDRVSVGPVVMSIPVIDRVEVLNGRVEIRWRGVRGARYRIQTSPDGGSRNWVDEPGVITADGPFSSGSVAVNQPSRFLRIAVLP